MRRLDQQPLSKRVAGCTLEAIASVLAPLVRPGTRVPADQPLRIGVFAPWGIGDALLLLPLLRALKRRYPDAAIELIGQELLREVFAAEPAVDSVDAISMPWTAASGKYRLWGSRWRTFAAWVQARRCAPCDWLITTRGDVREHVLAAVIGAPRRFGYAAGSGSALLTDLFPGAPPTARRQHIVASSREIARWFGVAADEPDPEIILRPDERAAAREWLSEQLGAHGRPWVGVHLGASFAIRQWGVDRFRSTIESLRDHIGAIVLIADPDGKWRSFRPPAGVACVVFEGRLRPLFGLMSHLDVLLCNDSGVMHAAAAVGTPVVAPFGPTSPDWFAPLGPNSRIVRRPEFRCGPCVDRCRFGTASCMNAVEVPHVSHALSAAIGCYSLKLRARDPDLVLHGSESETQR